MAGDRQKAVQMLERLREMGANDSAMLEHILYNYVSGKEAVEILEDMEDERENGGI